MATASEYGKEVCFLSTWILIHCMVLLQVPSTNCFNDKTADGMPVLPFCVDLLGTLRSSHVIKLIGFVEQTSLGQPTPWLEVVLHPTCLVTDSPFYLKMRFDTRRLMVATFRNGTWSDEESDAPFPFSQGEPFLLLIEVKPDGYKITGNGVPLWTFAHRLSYANVSALKVSGKSAKIRRVELIDQEDKDQPGKTQIIYPVPLGPKTVHHPSFPFSGYFPEGLQAGKAIRISGIITRNIQKLSVNLCADCSYGPIMLHLDLRFHYGADVRVAVRNIYQNGNWGNYAYEERDGPFPFVIREPFEVQIEVQPDSYNIKVNGLQCWTFAHRLPFTQVTSMTITKGPMSIWSIQYIDIPDQDMDVSEAKTPKEGPAPAEITTSSSYSGIYRIPTYNILFISFTCSLLLI